MHNDRSCSGWGEELGEGAVLGMLTPMSSTGLSQLRRLCYAAIEPRVTFGNLGT